MKKSRLILIIIFFSTIIISGCNPTATTMPPTATPLPPTETPTATPTVTPTATPTATEVYDISDSEFAEKAKDTCNSLLRELKNIYTTIPSNADISEAYRQAAKSLGQLHYTSQSAPLGYQLQNNMTQYAEVLEEYRSSYNRAISEAGITGPGIYRVTTDFTIEIISFSGDTKIIDFNRDLVEKYHTSKDAFLEAATELGLDGCAVNESDLKN